MFSGALITKLHKHPRIKSEILFKIAKRRRFAQPCSLFAAGGETVAAAKAVIKGPCPRLISLRPLLRPCKEKRLHPLAIKARGCTAQKRERERQRKVRKQRGKNRKKKRRDREEKGEQKEGEAEQQGERDNKEKQREERKGYSEEKNREVTATREESNKSRGRGEHKEEKTEGGRA